MQLRKCLFRKAESSPHQLELSCAPTPKWSDLHSPCKWLVFSYYTPCKLLNTLQMVAILLLLFSTILPRISCGLCKNPKPKGSQNISYCELDESRNDETFEALPFKCGRVHMSRCARSCKQKCCYKEE